MTAPAPTLYSLSDELVALMDSADCVPEEHRAEFEQRVAECMAMLIKKCDNIHRFLVHCETQAGMAAAEIKRLQERKARFERAAEHLERYTVSVMEQRGLQRLEGETCTLSLRKAPDSVRIVDESVIPAEFVTVKTVTQPDKRAIGKAIKGGREVPGADLMMGGNALVRK